MEVYANELSITIDTFDKYENIVNFRDSYQRLYKYGLNSCRINSESLNQIYKVITADPQKRNLLDFIFSFLHAPFDTDEIIEQCADEYLMHEWKCNRDECVGLAYAYIMDSLALSFTRNNWDSFVKICRDAEIIETRNVSCADHFEDHKDWFESLRDVELIKTETPADEKQIHLRDDHGKDKLLDFTKKVCSSPYVISVINSLPFNAKDKKFIRKVKADGLIECVMTWTDKGYGFVIQTTGRNLRETEKIAAIINDEYGE